MSRRRATRPPVRRRGLRWVLPGLLGLLLVTALLLAWQARTAYTRLEAAEAKVPLLREQITSGNDAGARATAARFLRDTEVARDAVHGPAWSLLAAVPGLGRNVEAAQTVTATLDDLAAAVLPEVVDAAGVVDPSRLAPRDGRIDLEPIRAAAPHVHAARDGVAEAEERIAAVDTAGLVGPLQRPIDEMAGTLGEIRELMSVADRTASLLPRMLGGQGPRHYLLLTQNNAEPRALGGIPGALILLRADQGRIELLEQRTAGSFGDFGEPVLPLTAAERTLYGSQLGRFAANVTATPDFPRAARLIQEMWRRDTGRTVDGVLTVDPYALQLLLRASGPVRLPDSGVLDGGVPDGRVPGGRVLTGRNTAQVLLNQVYLDFPDPSDQDAFFAAAAAAIFDKVTAGTGDLRATTEALATATRQHRIMLWSAHPAEQRRLRPTTIAGRLRGAGPDDPVVGIYLHDRTPAKIAYYERVRARLLPSSCDTGPTASSASSGSTASSASSAGQVTLRVRISSHPPADVAELPPYIAGAGANVPVGHVRTEVLVYAPPGAVVSAVRQGGRPTAVSAQRHEGLHVVSTAVDLGPGDRVTLEYDLKAPAVSPEDLRLRVTPGPTPRHFAALPLHCRS